jgi:hypothetical protein
VAPPIELPWRASRGEASPGSRCPRVRPAGIDDGIAQLGAVAQRQPDLDSEGLVAALTDRGLDLQSARRLVVFVPLALGRVLLDGLGITFADTYLVANATHTTKHPLADVPEFIAASAAGASGQLPPDQLSGLALRSSEVDAVNQALHNGSQPQHLILSPPVTSRI